MTVRLPSWSERCRSDQRWICSACGRVTEPGAQRLDLLDASCIHWAVRCWADQRDGKWEAAPEEPA